MISLSRVLTILIIVFAVTVISVASYNQVLTTRNSYSSKIEYSFARSPLTYDFSCDENDYQIHFVITNTGNKNVMNLSASITNPLCVGGIPMLPQTLKASSAISFYVQTTSANGTLSISGNNTFVQIRF